MHNYLDTAGLKDFAQKLTAKNKTMFAVKSLETDVEELRAAVGSPLVAEEAADMTDTDKIYVYVGEETGYTAGDWYYYDGTEWQDGGVYNSTAFVTDTTLSVEGMAADAEATGDAVEAVDEKVDALTVPKGYVYIDQTWPGFTVAVGKSADGTGLSDSVNMTTYYFVAPDDFKLYFTNYNTTYTCVAFYSGEINQANFVIRYRTSAGNLPTSELAAVSVTKGYSVAITINHNAATYFKLWTNSDAINHVLLSSSIDLADSQINQVINALPATKACKLQYISGSWNENSTERLFIYLPTTVGYVRYSYVHTVKADRNADVWRLSTAYSVDNSLSEVNQLTTSGEWECAVHIDGRSDFSGGNAHGDEVQTSQSLWVDGKAYTISSLTSLTEFSELRIIRKSNLYDPADGTTIIAEHGVEYTITKDGITVRQSVLWKSAYTITPCYLGMFPVIKADGNDVLSKYYYTDKELLLKEIPSPVNTSSPNVRRLVLTSADNCVEYSFIGKEITLKIATPRMLISDNGGLNYNKLYDTVNTQGSTASVSSDELWKSEHVFRIVIAA